MIEIRYEITEKQEQMLHDRCRRVLFMRCSEAALQSRIASAICESELHEIIKKYDLCDICDFSGLHISVAKMLVKCVITVLYKYPRLRGGMNFIGSRRGYFTLLDAVIKSDAKAVKELGMQYIMNAESMQSVGLASKELLERSSSSEGNTLAQAVAIMGILDGIMIDEEDFNSKEFRKIKIELERAVATKQSPQGCASVEAVIYHEIGHLLDFLCHVNERQEVIAEFNSYTEEQLTDKLSSYAATSVQEYIAEGFAECMASLAPRYIAKRILQQIDDSYKVCNAV